MAAIILSSQVLSGSVRLDVVAVEALGASKVNAWVPGNRTSMRPPMPAGGLTGPTGDFATGEDYPSSGLTPGAGRPRRTWHKRDC